MADTKHEQAPWEASAESHDSAPWEAPSSSADVSMPESALAGAETGLTFGTAAPISGDIAALMDKLGINGGITDANAKLAAQGFKGDVGPTSTLDLYRQIRNQKQAELNQAQQSNPGSFLAGNLGGAVLAGGGAKLAATAGAPGMAAASNLINPGPSIGGLIKAGAVGSGLQRAGTSDTDIMQNPGQAAGEAGVSSLVGGLAGLGLGVGGKVASLGGEAVGSLPMAKKLLAAYNLAKNGESVTDTGAIMKQADDLANNTISLFKNGINDLADKRNTLVKDANSSIPDTGAMTALQNLKDQVSQIPDYSNAEVAAKKSELTQMLNAQMEGKAVHSPEETVKVIDELRKYTPAGEKKALGGQLGQLQQVMTNGVRDLTGTLDEAVPGFADAQKNLSDMMTQRDYLLGKASNRFKSSADAQNQVDSLRNYLQNTGADQNPVNNFEMNKAIDQGVMNPYTDKTTPPLSQLNPDLAGYLQKNAQNVSQKTELAGMANQPGEATLNPLKATSSALVKGAEKVGQVAYGASKQADSARALVGDLSSKLTNLAPEQMVGLARQGMQKFGNDFAQYAKVLQDASTKKGAALNASVFGLMQQPQFRQLMNQMQTDPNNPQSPQTPSE